MGSNKLRGQRGHVRLEGRSFIGYWNTYTYDESTEERKRKQKSVRLGPKSMGKFEAEKRLAEFIEKSIGPQSAPVIDSALSFEKFARDRWMPLKEPKWRNSSRDGALHVLGHIYKKFGNTALDKIEKIALQNWLNDMAKKYSRSLVLHSRFYLKSILDEAVEQNYLLKNPAKKLEIPRTKRVDKTVLTAEQFRAVIAELKPPYDLLFRVGIASALRPSELFALRWKDFNSEAGTFTLNQSVYRGEIRPFTKTTEEDEGDLSLITVTIPGKLVRELVEYRGLHRKDVVLKKPERKDYATEAAYVTALKVKLKELEGKYSSKYSLHYSDQDFIFSTKEGTIMHKENVLFRVLRPIKEKLGIPVLNFQILRRTMATLSQRAGSVKDVQALLRHKTPDVTASEYMQSVPETTRTMVNDVYDQLIKEPSKAE
jgi:integrase